MYVSAFKKLGIDIIIKYNSRNLMTGLILESGIEEDLVPAVTTIIDKKDKLSDEYFKESLLEIGLNDKQVSSINKYFNMDIAELISCFKNTENEKIRLGLDEVDNLNKYLKGINIDKICELSTSLARGQNYYTGNVFEVYEANGKIKGSIGAGGRYDKIIGNFIGDGIEYPTVGISFGLSSIYELLKNSELFNDRSQIDIYIIPMNTDVQSLDLANRIRELGYNVEIDMTRKKFKKSMDYANKEKIPFVIVFGEDEVKNQFFKIKNMLDGNEYKIKIDDLTKLKKVL